MLESTIYNRKATCTAGGPTFKAVLYGRNPQVWQKGQMDSSVKFLMLFKGSLLPPLTDLLSRIEGSVPQRNVSF